MVSVLGDHEKEQGGNRPDRRDLFVVVLASPAVQGSSVPYLERRLGAQTHRVGVTPRA